MPCDEGAALIAALASDQARQEGRSPATRCAPASAEGSGELAGGMAAVQERDVGHKQVARRAAQQPSTALRGHAHDPFAPGSNLQHDDSHESEGRHRCLALMPLRPHWHRLKHPLHRQVRRMGLRPALLPKKVQEWPQDTEGRHGSDPRQTQGQKAGLRGLANEIRSA